MKLIVCSPMQLPALNGTTIYAEQLRKYFNAKVVASNALDWKAVYKKGKKGKGHSIIYNPLFKNSKIFVKAERATRKLPLLNSTIHGPVAPGMLPKLLSMNWDVIYSLTLPFFNNYIALWSAKILKRKCVITPFYIKGAVPDSYAKLLKKYDLIFACTKYEKQCLEKLGVKNIKISPMCVDPKPFEKADGIRFRKKYKIKSNEKIVLFVGNANYEKGAYALLKAAKKVSARFVFLGSRTPGFRARAKGLKNVLLVNPQLKNKYDAFAACDVYAMPSRIDAFGIAYLEAWAAKKPVIAADTLQAKEIIEDAGLLVRFNDVKSLTKAIKESFGRRNLGLKGYKKLIKNYTEEKVMKKLKGIITSLC